MSVLWAAHEAAFTHLITTLSCMHALQAAHEAATASVERREAEAVRAEGELTAQVAANDARASAISEAEARVRAAEAAAAAAALALQAEAETGAAALALQRAALEGERVELDARAAELREKLVRLSLSRTGAGVVMSL